MHLAPYRKWHRNPALSPAWPIPSVSCHAWFGILVMAWRCAKLAEAAWRNNGPKARRRPRTNAPVPDHGRLYADMAKLFLQDLANVESGIYPIPADHDGSLLTLVSRSRLFFEDLPEIHRRREVRGHRRFSIKIRAARGRATICRIFTFNRAAG